MATAALSIQKSSENLQATCEWGGAQGSQTILVDSIWNVMAHGDAREGKWRGNWRMEWVASTLHTTSEHGVSSITTADAHTSAASSRLKPPRRFKWTRPFSRKTKSGFCACAITFRTQSTSDRAIAGLSYSRFKAIRHKYQCQLPSKGPLVIGRRVWIQRFLSGKLGQQQRRQPNTSKHSNQYQNKLRKGILVLTLADK